MNFAKLSHLVCRTSSRMFQRSALVPPPNVFPRCVSSVASVYLSRVAAVISTDRKISDSKCVYSRDCLVIVNGCFDFVSTV